MKLIKLFLGIGIITALLFACGTENSPVKKDNNDNDSTKVDELVPHLGANFNARLGPNFVRFSELRSSHTTWIRGMLDFFHLYRKYKGGKNWMSDPNILTYKKLKRNGYKTALAIRYTFNREGLTVPEKGTNRFDDYMSFTDALLQVVLPGTDVFTPGNEPFFEAPQKAKHSQRVVDFYEALAKHTHTYIAEHDLDIPIFIGSFTGPHKSFRQNNAKWNELISFAAKTDWVAGVDIHIHHKKDQALYQSMDYISKIIRPGQRIIISEYSLVGWWGKHRRVDLSSSFKAKYSQSVPDSVEKVWQYLNFALQHPRPIEEWNDWNRMTPWLYNRRHYICHSWHIFNSYDKFWLAFYSFKLGWRRSFKPTDAAWILNSLLVNRTVEHKPNGDAYPRIWYMDDYKAIQAEKPTSCK